MVAAGEIVYLFSGTNIGVYGSMAIGIFVRETGEPIEVPVEVQTEDVIRIRLSPNLPATPT